MLGQRRAGVLQAADAALRDTSSCTEARPSPKSSAFTLPRSYCCTPVDLAIICFGQGDPLFHPPTALVGDYSLQASKNRPGLPALGEAPLFTDYPFDLTLWCLVAVPTCTVHRQEGVFRLTSYC